MPNMPVSTVSGRKIVEMTVSVFITWFRRLDVNDRCASSSDGDAIVRTGSPRRPAGRGDRRRRGSGTTAAREICGNSRRASRPTTSRCGVTTRRSDATSRLSAEDLPDVVRRRLLEDVVLELVEPRLELVDLGPVVVDHRVDDAVQQRRRPLGQHEVVARTDVAQVRDRPRELVVHGDEELLAEEDVDLVRREACAAPPRSRCRAGSGRGGRRSSRPSASGSR